jgi:hypothetical protein
MGHTKSRIKKLEQRRAAGGGDEPPSWISWGMGEDRSGRPPWGPGERIAAALEKLHWHKVGCRPEHCTGHWYTDPEIRSLAAYFYALPYMEGEPLPATEELPSGAILHFSAEPAEPDEEPNIRVRYEGPHPEPEDLPDHARPYVLRMPPEKQAAHEWLWYDQMRIRQSENP